MITLLELVQSAQLLIMGHLPKKRHPKRHGFTSMPIETEAKEKASAKIEINSIIPEKKSQRLTQKVLAELPVESVTSPPVDEIRLLLKTHYPLLKQHESIYVWIKEIVILTAHEEKAESEVLKNIGRALEKRNYLVTFQSVEFYSVENQEHCLVIGSKDALKSSQALHPHIRKNGDTLEMGKVPLILISNLSEFVQNPSSRIAWWNQLQTYL